MMAKTTTVKKPTISRKSNASKILEEKHIGLETLKWNDLSEKDLQSKISETLRHYNYFYDWKDGYEWAKSWVSINRPHDLKNFSSAEPWRVSMTLGGMCRIHTNGANLSDKNLKWMETKIDEVVKHGKSNLLLKTSVARSNNSEPYNETTSEFIGEIEDTIDLFLKDKSDEWKSYSVLEKLKSNSHTTSVAKCVVEYYTPLLTEISEVIEKKSEDLQYAYRTMRITKVKEYQKLIQKIIAESTEYIEGKKVVRKPIAKKPVSVEKQISKVNYLKEDDALKLKGMDVSHIIGSNMVVLYNRSYETISLLNCSNPKGFSIKGTTIQDVDEKTSFKKKLRKPELQLQQFINTTKIRCNKCFSEIRTTQSEASGRLNSETLILKVYK
jgi:hypothetical protein